MAQDFPQCLSVKSLIKDTEGAIEELENQKKFWLKERGQREKKLQVTEHFMGRT